MNPPGIIRNPFGWIPRPSQSRVFVFMALLTLIVSAILLVVGLPLTTDDAPYGIVSFQLARNLVRADNIMGSWEDTGRVSAGLSLGLDYLFIPLYVGAISLGCVLVGYRLTELKGWPWLASCRLWFAWGLGVAGILDGVENFGLIQALIGSRQEYWVQLAYWCALIKFLLFGVGILYLVIGGLAVKVFTTRSKKNNRGSAA